MAKKRRRWHPLSIKCVQVLVTSSGNRWLRTMQALTSPFKDVQWATYPRGNIQISRILESLIEHVLVYTNTVFWSKNRPNWSTFKKLNFKHTIIFFQFSGLKLRMRDHYRSQKMALWLNLVPDLQSAAAASYGRNAAKKEVVSGMPNNYCLILLWSSLFSVR